MLDLPNLKKVMQNSKVSEEKKKYKKYDIFIENSIQKLVDWSID